MKIVINTDQIYLHGGIEKVMATKVNYWLQQPNTEVIILTTEQKNKEPKYALDPKTQFIDLGVNYNRSKSYFSIENIKKAILHFRRQRMVLNKLKPEVIISPNYNFDHYWLPLIKGKSQLIKERHGSRVFENNQRQDAGFLKNIKFKFNDWIDAQYDNIVVLNDTEKTYVQSNNAVVIPNPVELTTLTTDRSKKQVMAAGRIAPVKRFQDLITAWMGVKTNFPDWQLHIYGEDYGDTKKQLQQLIKDNGLQDVVFFKDSVDNLPLSMTEYSIYAMSSETECFPMVLLEAQSVGLPIVSYNCPNGPKHIINNEVDGLLVEHKNTEHLAQALMRLMSDEDLLTQMGQQAKINANRFSTQEVMKMWQNALNKSNV